MSRQRILSGIVCALLALVTLLVYLPVRHHAFVNFDDPDYVTENPMVRAGLTWTGVQWAFATLDAGNWHPLTWLSHMLDCQLFAWNAGGHHLVSVLFHATNAALLFLLLLRMTGASWQSAFIAALFAWHPLHVESVAWVAERKDVLSAFFGLLTLLAYVGYAQKRSKADMAVQAPDSHLSTFDYLLALFFFACGLMAKPMLVTLPLVFLLLDYWPLQRVPNFELRFSHWSRLVWEKWPFFVLAAASCAITFIAQKRGTAVVSLEAYPLSSRIGNVAVAYVKYLFKSVYPVNLAVIYPLPREISWVQVAGAILMLAAISWLIWRVRRQRPYLLTGWLWYLGMLVPVIGVVQVGSQAMADRYTYLPLIGVFIGVVFGLGELVGKLRITPGVTISVAGIVLAGCLFATARQLQYWQDSETLFEHTLAITTDNPTAQTNLGFALAQAGHPQEAMEHLREVMRLEPDSALAHNNLGNALLHSGHPHAAIEQFREALRLEPDFVPTKIHNNLGNALLEAGQPQAATEQFREALRLEPNSALAHNNLAIALAQTGRLPEAIEHYQEALRLQSNFPEAQYDLGLALLQNGQTEEAITRFQTALQLQPDFTAARNQLGEALLRWGQILFKRGQMNQALVYLQQGLQIHPGNAGAYNCLGYISLGQRQIDGAVTDFQKALELQPDNVETQNNLAWVLATAPDASLRDGVKALELAQRANQLSGGQNPAVLGTLAAAYAEVGRFPNAVTAAQKALQLAGSQTNTAPMVNDLQTQTKFYQAGSPFRDLSLINTPPTSP